MAYRLKLNEPMGRGFQRIAIAQIDRAIVQIDAATETVSVHEARKCLKRTRALLRFFRPRLGDDTFKNLNSALRDIGQSLSGPRDIDVLGQTVAHLAQAGDLKPAIATRLNAALASARTAMSAGTQRTGDRRDIIARLSRVRDSIGNIALEADNPDLDTTGLGRCFDDCHKAFKTALETGDDEAFHEWRKTVQVHWRHMQLISAAWPEYCAARIAEARAISALVGADRDLGLLLTFATTGALNRPVQADAIVARLPVAAQRALTTLVAEQRAPLRAQARLHGERLLAEGTSGLCRRLNAYWEAAADLRELRKTASPPG